MKEKLFFKLIFLVIFTSIFGCKYNSLPNKVSKKIIENKIEISSNRIFRPNLDTTSQTILLIGDSMAHFLTSRLNDYCEQNNHSFYSVTWVSSNIEWFADCDTINYFIKKYSPTYILFVIGSNKIFTNDTSEINENIRKVEEKFTGLKALWIGPPNLGGKREIDDILLLVLSEKQFFSSKKLKFESKSVGDLHPSTSSSTMWMDSIANWIVTKSNFPIKMDFPLEKSKKEINSLVLKPLY